MRFLSYNQPSMNDGAAQFHDSSYILRARREELALSQQQVAEGAGILLRQYQRLETGERNIESASLKLALSICAVLQLDPFTFLPGAEGMNAYIDIAFNKEQPHMKKEYILQLANQAFHLFNQAYGTNYSDENIKFAFCTLKDYQRVYVDFTRANGFHFEPQALEDFNYTYGEALVGQTDCAVSNHCDGILLRTDPPAELDNPEIYLRIVVHELAHIFCSTHEIESASFAGKRFYDRYCSSAPTSQAERTSDGQIVAGYAIWREFIAEMITNTLLPIPPKPLAQIVPYLLSLSKDIVVGNLSAKYTLHRFLAEVLSAKESRAAKCWDDLEPLLVQFDLPFIAVTELVFNHIHHGVSYMIDLPFIEELGMEYIAELIKNSPRETLMAFFNSYSYNSSNNR